MLIFDADLESTIPTGDERGLILISRRLDLLISWRYSILRHPADTANNWLARISLHDVGGSHQDRFAAETLVVTDLWVTVR